MSDSVNHPKHYNEHPSGIECIDVVEHMGFNLGNAVKYIWRADFKGDSNEDLRKAIWYIERELQKREKKPELKPMPPLDMYTCPKCWRWGYGTPKICLCGGEPVKTPGGDKTSHRFSWFIGRGPEYTLTPDEFMRLSSGDFQCPSE